jgi:hypothetical protein
LCTKGRCGKGWSSMSRVAWSRSCQETIRTPGSRESRVPRVSELEWVRVELRRHSNQPSR